MISSNDLTGIYGKIFNPIEIDKTDYFENGLLIFNDYGRIVYCGDAKSCNINEENFLTVDLKGSIILPGFVDAHTHLPQYPVAGIGTGQLLDWLENYIFPIEKKFNNNEFAFSQSEKFFDDILLAGTTTASIYTSLHDSAAEIAFDVAKIKKIRAYIGPVLMDLPNNNDYYESDIANLHKIMNLVNLKHNEHSKLQFVLTPRYAGSCSLNLMHQCSVIANEYNLNIQTHLAENLSELSYINTLYPQFNNYTEVYEKSGLITEKTILAHCIFNNSDEIEIIKKSGASICHCPTSNRFLSSGVMPLMSYLKKGLNVCLGTDVAGGYSCSMINEMKEAIETTKTYNIINNTSKVLKPESALYMATLAGAKALKNNDIGNFEIRKFADFVVIKPDFDYNDLNSTEILSKLIYSNSLYTVNQVYIEGERII